ncbi:MAG TPA: peptidylprolyl isomerase [Candidatus Faecousia intestinigallinarum]|nr:peptidylprolyl isomerase [Candidatus Faecousia intestinigallinarum]
MSASSKKKLRKEQESELLTERQRTERKEAKKLKTYTILFITVMVLIVVLAAGILIGRWVTTSGYAERNTPALTVGEHTLSNAEFSYYYMDTINSTYTSWKNTYGEYASMYLSLMGLDLTKPLDEQVYNQETGETWTDYFVQTALDNVRNTYAVYDAAVAEGYTLSEDELADVDAAVESMETVGKVYHGYSDLERYLKATYGYGASVESFREYCLVTALASSYQYAHSDSLSYTDEDIRAYDAEHAQEFNSYTYSSVYLNANSFLTDGTVDEDGNVTYTDEQKAAALESAKAAADSLLSADSQVLLDKLLGQVQLGTTAEDEELTSTKSEEILYSSINSAFQDWISDPARQAGDITIIPNESTATNEDGSETTTTYGYYVVLFEGSTDNTLPMGNVRHLLVAFEGGTTDENDNTTYSDEEKAAAKTQAEELLAQWQAGDATEESFSELVKENTDDTASASTGGLFENINPNSNYVEPFLNWALESHQAGDTGIIETEYGYHIMYYVGDSELNYRDAMIESRLRADDMTAWYDALVEATTVTELDTSKVYRDIVLSSGA